jgi:hypothetical protein
MNLLQETREACLEVCARSCDGCVVRTDMSECFCIALECAEVCQKCAEVIARFDRSATPLEWLDLWCGFCATICESCAADCERFDAPLFQHCAELCRGSAKECRSPAADIAATTSLKEEG